MLTALSPVLLSLTNLHFLDLSPTVGIGRAQPHEELALCQAWSKVCGLRKVVFPSGDVWLLVAAEPEPMAMFKSPDAWILYSGHTVSAKPWWEDGVGSNATTATGAVLISSFYDEFGS